MTANRERQDRYLKTEKGRAVRRKVEKKRRLLGKDKYRRASYDAVRQAIKFGRLKPAKSRKCVDCGKQAQHYHHESYKWEHRLHVIPVCISCHRARDKKRRPPTAPPSRTSP